MTSKILQLVALALVSRWPGLGIVDGDLLNLCEVGLRSVIGILRLLVAVMVMMEVAVVEMLTLYMLGRSEGGVRMDQGSGSRSRIPERHLHFEVSG